MKRELIAGSVLIALFAAVLFNSFYLTKLSGTLSAMVEKAEEASAAEEWETSAANAAEAIELWNKSNKYTHIFLNHDEIGLLSDSFFELMEKIHAKNPDTVCSVANMVKTRLEDLAKMETPAPGSIF